jgi:hypothetical protein
MYGTAGSITKWVEQVETARTPIVPDISILRKESAPPATPPEAVKPTVMTETQLKSAVSMPRFKELLTGLPLTASLSSLSASVASSLAESARADSASSSVTLCRIEPGSWPPAPLQAPQHQLKQFAVKSRPPQVVLEVSSRQREDNPLLNQPLPEATASTQPAVVIIAPRASKRPRTEAAQLPELTTTATKETLLVQQTHRGQQQSRQQVRLSDGLLGSQGEAGHLPTDLSWRPPDSVKQPFAGLRSPLSLNTTAAFPLRLETAYSTVSPPLNLSASSPFSSGPQTTAFDYTLGGGKSHLLSGQLERLKNQDQRSGI